MSNDMSIPADHPLNRSPQKYEHPTPIHLSVINGPGGASTSRAFAV